MTSYIGKVVMTHAPADAYPPADMIEQGFRVKAAAE